MYLLKHSSYNIISTRKRFSWVFCLILWKYQEISNNLKKSKMSNIYIFLQNRGTKTWEKYVLSKFRGEIISSNPSCQKLTFVIESRFWDVLSFWDFRFLDFQISDCWFHCCFERERIFLAGKKKSFRRKKIAFFFSWSFLHNFFVHNSFVCTSLDILVMIWGSYVITWKNEGTKI